MSEMRVTYQIQIAEGQTLAYEIGADTNDGPEELRKVLDLVGDAAERRKAMHDLPFHKARLLSNRERIGNLRKDRAKAEANLNAHVSQISAGRRKEAVPLQTDVNAVAQWDKQIADAEALIKADELRIPYMEAIIAGREPPELFPETREFLAAAE